MLFWIEVAALCAVPVGVGVLLNERRKNSVLQTRIQNLQRELGVRECIERQLQASQSNLQMATEASGIGTWYWDLQTDEFSCSEQALKFYGYEKTNRTYRSSDFISLVHPDDQNHLRAALENALRADGRYQVEYRIIRRDGRIVWLSTAGRGWKDSDGDVRRVAGITADVTERKRLEENFYQAQKMEAVGRLAGGVAHDFNNMLGIISAYAELLMEDQSLPQAAAKRVDEIMAATQRAHVLTRQLLAFSRKQVITPTMLDLNAVIHGISDMLQRMVGKGVCVTTELADGLPAIQADRVQLEQALLNFAANSRDAMPKGGTFRLKTGFQSVGPDPNRRSERGFVLIEISDTGCGMDAATLKHIFEPFFTTKAAGKGTGLGLASIYGLVEQLHGQIAVESVQGRGTTFRMYLPASSAPLVQPAESLKPTAVHAPRILLVEDEAALREILTHFMESEGMRVHTANSGREALAKIRSGDTIDLLVTDLSMPEMDGHTLAAKAQGIVPGLQVIYISGKTESSMESDMVKEGLYLQKPFSRSDLVSAIQAMTRPVA